MPVYDGGETYIPHDLVRFERPREADSVRSWPRGPTGSGQWVNSREGRAREGEGLTVRGGRPLVAT